MLTHNIRKEKNLVIHSIRGAVVNMNGGGGGGGGGGATSIYRH